MRVPRQRNFGPLAPTVAGALLTGLALCSLHDNPYANAEHSRAVIEHASFALGDTIPIFAADTIWVAFHVPSHVDSVALRVPVNRPWGPDTTFPFATPQPSTLQLMVSFYDTGWHAIRLRTYRDDGETVTATYGVRAVSPLRQKTLRCRAGDTLRLATPPVEAPVRYVWVLGGGLIIHGYRPEAGLVMHAPLHQGIGKLYVDDGRHRSPSSPFKIVPIDDGGFGLPAGSEPARAPEPSIEIPRQPEDREVDEEESVSFTVGARGEDLAYQWQRNGRDIPGATAATYTIEEAAMRDNGARYRCIVSNPAGSVASRAARLEVERD